MNKRALFFLFLFLALPVQAHHTKEHVLGAPQTPVIAPNPETTTSSGTNFWFALGPFFALAALGALRWGYRRHRDGKHRNARG